MMPEKVPETLLPPTVNVGVVELALLSPTLLPAPLLERPLTVSLNPPRSNVAVPLAGFITTSPLPAPSGMTLAAPSFKVPALIVVLPANVFAPESVSVPDPDLVNAPVLLMTPLMVEFPAPPHVRPKVPLSTLPLTVNVPPVEPMVEALARVIAPDQLFVPLTFSSAPAPLTPALFSVNGSVLIEMPPCNCKEAPLSTVVPPLVAPSAEVFWMLSTPAATSVVPL